MTVHPLRNTTLVSIPNPKPTPSRSCVGRFFSGICNLPKRACSAVGRALTSRHVQRAESLKQLGAQIGPVESSLGDIQSTYISVQSFHNHLQDLGCKRVKLTLPGSEPCVAFHIPKESRESLEQALESAEFLRNGWTVFETKSGESYLTASTSFQAFSPGFKKNSKKCEVSAFPLDPKKSAGTVVLTGGVYSLSSSGYNYGELATWVLQGMNVQLFDFPGFGESTGTFCQADVDAAMNAVMENLKKTQEITNNDILLKGTCFGAGPVAAYAASEAGKGCHLLITDTAESTDELVQRAVADKLGKGKVAKAVAKGIVSPVLGFRYDLSEAIKGSTGGVAICRNLKDGYFGPGDTALEDPLVTALTESMESSKGRQLSYILCETGGHATPWQRDEAGRLQVQTYLGKLGLDREPII